MIGIWEQAAKTIDPVRDRLETRFADINGERALLIYLREKLETVFVFSTDAERITAIRAVRNPEKLAWLSVHA